jgi:hypothetical protein
MIRADATHARCAEGWVGRCQEYLGAHVIRGVGGERISVGFCGKAEATTQHEAASAR